MQIIGEINSEMFQRFDDELFELERKGKVKCDIVLNSEGGAAMDALAIASRMRRSKEDYGMKFTVTVYGLCASAAVIILAYGDVRRMTKESWVMVHEESRSELTGSVSEIENEARNMRKQEDQWNRLLDERTAAGAVAWAEMSKRDNYLAPNQCLALGLIDGII